MPWACIDNFCCQERIVRIFDGNHLKNFLMKSIIDLFYSLLLPVVNCGLSSLHIKKLLYYSIFFKNLVKKSVFFSSCLIIRATSRQKRSFYYLWRHWINPGLQRFLFYLAYSKIRGQIKYSLTQYSLTYLWP